MRIGAVLAAALAAVAVGLGFVLADAEPRQAGTNYIPEAGAVRTIEGKGRHCQDRQVVPADTAAVRILLGTFERPAPAVTVSSRSNGRLVSSGRLAAGEPDGYIVVDLDRVEELQSSARVCVAIDPEQTRRKTVLYGSGGQVRLEWLRSGEETWLELVPTVATRFGLGKPFVAGSWVLILASVLLASAWVLALRLALRELRA